MDKCANKTCPQNKICNPASGRCVDRDGKIGRLLVEDNKRSRSNNKRSRKRSRSSKKRSRKESSKSIVGDKCANKTCPQNKICNPASGRCVNDNGNIGRTIRRKSPKKHSPPRQVIVQNNQAPINKFSYVSGLLTFSVHYSPIYNKQVYIMGEQHDKKDLCDMDLTGVISADTFFFNLLNSTNKLLDVYLESALYTTVTKNSRFSNQQFLIQNPHSSGFMSNVLNFLAKNHCITETYGKGCAIYRNHVRFHATDIRHSNIILIQYLFVLNFIAWSRLKSSEYVQYFHRLGNTGYFDTVESIRALIPDTLYSSKITKQMNSIPEKYKNVLLYLENSIDTLIGSVIQLLPYYDMKLYVEGKLNMDYIKSRIIRATAGLMDIYVLSRMFRTFKDIPDHLTGEPKNIIIYTGNNHSVNYIRILTDLGFNTIYQANKNDADACLNIENFSIKWI